MDLELGQARCEVCGDAALYCPDFHLLPAILAAAVSFVTLPVSFLGIAAFFG
jgi:hypothetical protein